MSVTTKHSQMPKTLLPKYTTDALGLKTSSEVDLRGECGKITSFDWNFMSLLLYVG